MSDQAPKVSRGARSQRTIRIWGNGLGIRPCSRSAARRVCLRARSKRTAAESDIPAKNCGAPSWPMPRGACTQLNQAAAPANSQTSMREPRAASPWLASRTASTEQNIAAPSRPKGTRYSQPPERLRFCRRIRPVRGRRARRRPPRSRTTERTKRSRRRLPCAAAVPRCAPSCRRPRPSRSRACHGPVPQLPQVRPGSAGCRAAASPAICRSVSCGCPLPRVCGYAAVRLSGRHSGVAGEPCTRVSGQVDAIGGRGPPDRVL